MKIRKRILSLILLSVFALILVACTDNEPKIDTSTSMYQIYQLGVNANLVDLTYEEWLESIKGEDGDSVEFQVYDGYIQWKRSRSNTWNNLYELEKLVGTDGKDGTNGKEVVFRVDEQHIQWQYEGSNTWYNLISLETLIGSKGDKGSDGKDGREVEFQVSEGYIQWKYENDLNWVNLVELSTLTGEKGDDGKDGLTPYIGENGNWWIGDNDTSVPANGQVEMDRVGSDGLTFVLTTYNGKLGYIVVDYIGDDINLIIPNEVLGIPVISIINLPRDIVSISISKNMVDVPSFANTNLESFDFNNAVNIDTIKKDMFLNASKLKNIYNYGEIKRIEANAFKGTKILDNNFDFSNIEEIGNNAFNTFDDYNNRVNHHVYLPNENIILGENVFNRDMIVYFAGDRDIINEGYQSAYLVKNISVNNDGFWYIEREDGITLYDYTGVEKEIVTPEFINGKIVDKIGYYAFWGHNNLTRIDFSENIKEIEGIPFVLNRSIEIITIPITYDKAFLVVEPKKIPIIIREHQFEDFDYSGNGDYYSFKHYHGATKEQVFQDDDFVYLDKGNEIEILVIKNNKETIIIPSTINNKNITKINSNAFIDREKIVKNIIISEGVQYILPYAFKNGDLRKLYIPSSVIAVNNYGIDYFNNLTVYVYANQKPLNWDSRWYGSVKEVVWNVKDFSLD